MRSTAHSLYGVNVDASEWLDGQREHWADGKAEAMEASPRLKFLSAHDDEGELVTVIGVGLDDLEPGRMIEAIRSAPLCLRLVGLEGVPMLHTLAGVW